MNDILANVRMATAQDEEPIMNLCRLLHEENGLFPMSEDRVRMMLRKCWAKDGGIVGVIGAPGEALEGCIYLLLNQMWYSDTWYLDELWNFVHPEHRKSNHAKALLTFAKKASDNIGVPLMVGILSNHRTEAKVRLYERQLPRAGAFFVYGATSGISGRMG